LDKEKFKREIEDMKNMLDKFESRELAIYSVIGWIGGGKKTYTSNQLKQIFDLVLLKENYKQEDKMPQK